MGDPNTSEPIRTTERSLDLVELVQRLGGARIGDITDKLDMSKSTAYKHLSTLESRGYLVKEGAQYHIGLKFTNRGEYARARKRGYRIASKKVDELADRTDEEVDFVVENDGRGMTIHLSYDPTNPFKEQSVDQTNKHWRTGTYYYLHCIAAGKAILSELPRADVEAIIDAWGLPKRTEQTISNPEALLEELENIRKQGYVYSNGEYADGLAAVAMPILSPTGEPLGALAVNGPSYNFMGEERRSEIVTILTDVVADFESELKEVEHPDPFLQGKMF